MNPQMSPCFARHLPDPHRTCSSGRTRAMSSVTPQCCCSTTYRGIRLVFTPAPLPMLLGLPLQTSPSLCSVSGRGGRGGEQIEGSGKGRGNQHLDFHYNVSNVCVCVHVCVRACVCGGSVFWQHSQHTPCHTFPACSPSNQHADKYPSCGPPDQPHPLLLL